jgi:hypothetical protein
MVSEGTRRSASSVTFRRHTTAGCTPAPCFESWVRSSLMSSSARDIAWTSVDDPRRTDRFSFSRVSSPPIFPPRLIHVQQMNGSVCLVQGHLVDKLGRVFRKHTTNEKEGGGNPEVSAYCV